MSYDIQIWSVRRLQAPFFRHPERWHQEGEAWVYAGGSWQIVVGLSASLQPEDVPEEIGKVIPGIAFLIEINLEGNPTGEARRLLQATVNDIAKATHGVIVDQQAGTFQTPSGVKRFTPPKKQETFEVLSLSWWFLESPLLSGSGREAFLNVLERLLPEAMPRRYGLYEPPQHIFAETGKAHLVQFLDANFRGGSSMVFYPHRPVVSLSMGFPDPPGPHKLGFRVNRIHIDVEKEVLSQPGWADGLRRFWREASRLIRPFYGDIRTLGGFIRRGATIYVSGNRGRLGAGLPPCEHPVKVWWWRGIPERLGCAVVLGEPYLKLWPAFVQLATSLDNLAFLSAPDWSGRVELSELLGGVPEPLQQPPQDPMSHDKRHAAVWPFDE